jgi:hypothetical protein
MPRIPTDYSKTIIYKLCCKDLEIKDIYIGSTTDFTKRKYAHKYNCNIEGTKSYNIKVYQIIRANKGWENWSMIQIEPFPCENKREAECRERYWYETLNANMNSNKICLSDKERKDYFKGYYENNIIDMKLYHRDYQRAHPDKVKAFTDKYYQKLKNDQPKYEAMLLLKKEKYQEKKQLIEMAKNDVNIK